ncbi:MAG: hypothetical protein JST54_12625 [Deltaproteobacteria bacterium]|nr:hypothetical protein [Deltaproteobacteria bacterium]
MEKLWSACSTVDQDAEVGAYLRGRNLYPYSEESLDESRALPREYPWPKWWPQSWSSSWRLVIRAYEPNGDLGSLHARAIDGSEPKTRWPANCAASGLLFADHYGHALLKGDPDLAKGSDFDSVLICEGLADHLAAIRKTREARMACPIIGIASGGAQALAKVRWPVGTKFKVGTHPDKTGEKYVQQILAALPREADVRRIHLEEQGHE